ncbi:MAG: cupin domain-containing protein [Pseudomonadota bacterium]
MAAPALTLGDLSPEAFVANHWQKKPLLVRQAGPAPDEFDYDTIIDVACDEEVDSRLVIGDGKSVPWNQTVGPLDPDQVPEREDTPWTILIRHAERWQPTLSLLQSALSFIPAWRHQDVMVSYATPGGSVGPHTDQYDVFLFQGPGRRRWIIGETGNHTPEDQGGLNLIEPFNQTASYTVEPGDLLYLPPGVPHWGIAEEPCLTYSIGFRAPTASDLLWALATVVAESEQYEERYGDLDLSTSEGDAAISDTAAQRAARLMQSATTSPALIAHALALWSSQPIADGPELEDPSEPMTWQRVPGSRLIIADDATLYADGEKVLFPPGAKKLADAIAEDRLWSGSMEGWSDDEKALLTDLSDLAVVRGPEG